MDNDVAIWRFVGCQNTKATNKRIKINFRLLAYQSSYQQTQGRQSCIIHNYNIK